MILYVLIFFQSFLFHVAPHYCIDVPANASIKTSLIITITFYDNQRRVYLLHRCNTIRIEFVYNITVADLFKIGGHHHRTIAPFRTHVF